MNNDAWKKSNRPSRNENIVDIESSVDESNIIVGTVENGSSEVDDQYQ